MQSTRKAKIGVISVIAGVALAFAWWYSVGYLFLAWYWSYRISALMFATLAVAPSIALTVVGLASYGAGQRDFWKTYSRRKELLAFLGSALMLVGGFFVAYIWAFSVYAANKSQPPYAKPLTYYLANNPPYLVLFALWFMAGLLVFADSLEAYWRKE